MLNGGIPEVGLCNPGVRDRFEQRNRERGLA
jgi:hypothetical protein